MFDFETPPTNLCLLYPSNMRKQLLLIILGGVIIGIILAVIIMAVSKTATPAEAELLKPVKANKATMADRSISAAQGVIEKKLADPKDKKM